MNCMQREANEKVGSTIIVERIFEKAPIEGLAQTYWGERIIKAARRKSFTDSDRREANNWVSCACGRADILVRLRDGSPDDPQLRELGGNFAAFVTLDNFAYAARVLVAIEVRARAILAAGRFSEEYELPMGGLG